MVMLHFTEGIVRKEEFGDGSRLEVSSKRSTFGPVKGDTDTFISPKGK